MKKIILSIWLALVMSLVIVTPALATIITVEVEGTVNSITTDGGLTLDGLVTVGSEMTGYCTYDTDTPDLGSGSYAMISISMHIGNYTFTHNPTSPDPPMFRVYTADRVYIASSDAPRFDGTVYVDGEPKTYDDIIWGWTYLELFNLGTSSDEYITNDALPDLDTWPDLSVFDWRRAFETRFYGEGNDYFGIYGEITSLTPMPEPATVLLLALGSLTLLRKRRA